MRQRPGNSRSIVAAVGALAIVIGPQWCCCSLTASAAPFAAAAGHGSCCCREQPTDAASSCPAGGGRNDGDPCPCRGEPRTVATLVESVVSGWQLDIESWTGGQSVWSTAWMPAAHRVSTSGSSVRPRGVEDVPVIGGRALLRALSMLRC